MHCISGFVQYLEEIATAVFLEQTRKRKPLTQIDIA